MFVETILARCHALNGIFVHCQVALMASLLIKLIILQSKQPASKLTGRFQNCPEVANRAFTYTTLKHKCHQQFTIGLEIFAVNKFSQFSRLWLIRENKIWEI